MDDLEKFSGAITYHHESGKFSWKTESRFNEPFTCNHPGGYLNGGFLGKTYYAHRVAWLMYYGEWPENHIDHINGDKRDNRIENLRQCLPSQNQCNKPSQRNSKSGIKGVSWSSRFNRWVAFISLNRKRKNLGYFHTKEDAKVAYDKACLELHGEFANLGGSK